MGNINVKFTGINCDLLKVQNIRFSFVVLIINESNGLNNYEEIYHNTNSKKKTPINESKSFTLIIIPFIIRTFVNILCVPIYHILDSVHLLFYVYNTTHLLTFPNRTFTVPNNFTFFYVSKYPKNKKRKLSFAIAA